MNLDDNETINRVQIKVDNIIAQLQVELVIKDSNKNLYSVAENIADILECIVISTKYGK